MGQLVERDDKIVSHIRDWVGSAGLTEGEIWRDAKNRLNRKPMFFKTDQATREMCTFQERSAAIVMPSVFSLFYIFRVFEMIKCCAL